MTQSHMTPVREQIEILLSTCKDLMTHACQCDANIPLQCWVHSHYMPRIQTAERILTEQVNTEDYIRGSILMEVCKEIVRGVQKYGSYSSLDQARFVVQDEVHELWWEIRSKERDFHRMRTEAIQVAATAMRLVEEIDKGEFRNHG